jgi:hypothetical protein
LRGRSRVRRIHQSTLQRPTAAPLSNPARLPSRATPRAPGCTGAGGRIGPCRSSLRSTRRPSLRNIRRSPARCRSFTTSREIRPKRAPMLEKTLSL